MPCYACNHCSLYAAVQLYVTQLFQQEFCKFLLRVLSAFMSRVIAPGVVQFGNTGMVRVGITAWIICKRNKQRLLLQRRLYLTQTENWAVAPVQIQISNSKFCNLKICIRTLTLVNVYCQNPNSTNNSIELNLRLDYILTERSTTHPPHHHTNSLLLLLLTAPASRAGNTVQLYSQSTVQPLCTTSLDFKVYLTIQF